jgi:sugar lactone lactonase YvrE
MKIIIFLSLFLLIPPVAYGSEIITEPEKILFDPNEWIKILVEIDGYSGGDISWNATLPDGASIDGILSNLKASKTTHTITRNAFDGQFGTWTIQYDYNDAVKIIDVNVEPIILSITTDKLSYLPGDTANVQFSTNYYNPSAALAETMSIELFDDKGLPANLVDDVKIKVYQPVINQQYSINELLSNNPFGVYHAIVTYYDIQVDVPFELKNPDTDTSIFLSSNKKLYSPNELVEVNVVMTEIVSDSGTLSVTLPSGQLITKDVSITNSLTRIILDDVDTSKLGVYSLEFQYGSSSTIGSFDVFDESIENDNTSTLEIEISLNKSQFRPGETIQATISTNSLAEDQIIYWFEDSQANQGQQFSFVNSASGMFTIPHTLSVDFLQGPSKIHVKYGSTETFAIFFVHGDAMAPSESSEIISYVGPEILLTIDDNLVNFGNIADVSISPNLELFVLDSETSKITIFDIKGNLKKSWGTIGNTDGQLNSPKSILAEKSLVHVSDAGNSRIVTFDNDGNFIRTWGNSGINYQSVQNPTDIAVDDFGIYYVSDGNQNKIIKFNTNGTYVGEINSILTASAKFSSIESITAHDDDVFLLSSTNNRILNFHSAGGFLKSFGTTGDGDKQLQNPTSLEFADDNNLYVADSQNNRVLVLNTAGEYVAKWGTYGDGLGEFNKMTGIDVDSNGDIWVADSGNRIQKFASLSGIDETNIPGWVKNNSAWWSEGIIDDETFVGAIKFLINEKIISVPEIIVEESESSDIPSWIKSNAGWWAEGIIDEQTFVDGIEFLVKTGIIQVN